MNPTLQEKPANDGTVPFHTGEGTALPAQRLPEGFNPPGASPRQELLQVRAV